MLESSFIQLKSVSNVERTQRGILANLEHELLRIDVINQATLRIKISRGGVFDENPSFALVRDPFELWAESRHYEFGLEVSDSQLVMTTSELSLTIQLESFGWSLDRTDGSRVFATGDLLGASAYSTLNDVFVLRRSAAPEDAILGLGEKSGRQNRRGRDFTLWNLDVLNPNASGEFTKAHPGTDPRSDNTSSEFDPFYVSIPFYYHQDAATGHVGGSFIDNGYRGFYDFTAENYYDIRFDGGQYTEYLFAGPDIASVLADYSNLTGRMALPPIWALGYQQCRWKAYSQDEVLALAKKHRDLDIPVDSLWLDINYMDEYRVFTWDGGLFPSPEAMLKELEAEGIRVVTIIDPGVKYDPGYEVFDSGLARDVFCKTEGGDIYIGQVWPGNTAFPDFVNPNGRDWWGELNAKHVQSGLAGIWNDMNEPATGDIPAERMRFGNGEFSHERYHNSYALLMAMGTVQGLTSAMPDLRTFVLSRAGSAGIQRYAANWMGDNFSRWDHLWVSIPMGAGLSLSGQPFVGADIGGFAEDSNPELFARWIQYGALTPFARNHNQANQLDQYAFSFGQEVLDIAREAIKLRYRLMPYLYSTFVSASRNGAPIQRPLVFDFQYDAETLNLDDEYLLGGDLLVAPVLEPGSSARSVYLPAGEWYDWHTGELHQGQQRIKAIAPLDTIPLFAKAGSVVPMWPEAPKSTHGYYPTAIELRVFVPSIDGLYMSSLTEDDGLTFAATSWEDAFVETLFTLERAGNKLTISGSTLGKSFPEFNRNEFRINLVGVGVREPLVIQNSGQDFSVEINL